MLLGWGRASLGWHRGTAWAGADKSQWVDGSSLGWWSGMSGAGRGEQSESLSAWQAGQEQGSFPAPGSLSCLLPAPHGHCTMCSFVERRKRFFWSGSLACQQNRIHGRPVPSTPFSSCPSHMHLQELHSLCLDDPLRNLPLWPYLAVAVTPRLMMSGILETDSHASHGAVCPGKCSSGGSTLKIYSKTRSTHTSAHTCAYTHIHRYASEGGWTLCFYTVVF